MDRDGRHRKAMKKLAKKWEAKEKKPSHNVGSATIHRRQTKRD